VEFRVDGVLVGTDTSSPYTAVWNATAASVGSHTIEAKAFDVAGNSAATAVQVCVSGSVPMHPTIRVSNRKPKRMRAFTLSGDVQERVANDTVVIQVRRSMSGRLRFWRSYAQVPLASAVGTWARRGSIRKRGIYYFRVRTVSPDGSVSAVSGQIRVVVR
jgi:hypothetical protein